MSSPSSTPLPPPPTETSTDKLSDASFQQSTAVDAAIATSEKENARKTLEKKKTRNSLSNLDHSSTRTNAFERQVPHRNVTFVEKLLGSRKNDDEQQAPQPQLLLTINREGADGKGKKLKGKKSKLPPRKCKSFGPTATVPSSRSRSPSHSGRNSPRGPSPSRKFSPTQSPPRTRIVRRNVTYEGNEVRGFFAFQSEEKRRQDERKKTLGTRSGVVQELSYAKDDLQSICDDKEAFATLKKTLQKHGAVTNEVLKQILPLYVKHHQKEEAKKETKGAKKKKCIRRAKSELPAPTEAKRRSGKLRNSGPSLTRPREWPEANMYLKSTHGGATELNRKIGI